jgi:hypothetical protein
MINGTVKEKWAELKHSSRFTGLVMALLGVMKLLNELGKPRIEALRGVDVLGLLTAGALLGMGFTGLMGRLNFAKSQNDQRTPPRNGLPESPALETKE